MKEVRNDGASTCANKMQEPMRKWGSREKQLGAKLESFTSLLEEGCTSRLSLGLLCIAHLDIRYQVCDWGCVHDTAGLTHKL